MHRAGSPLRCAGRALSAQLRSTRFVGLDGPAPLGEAMARGLYIKGPATAAQLGFWWLSPVIRPKKRRSNVQTPAASLAPVCDMSVGPEACDMDLRPAAARKAAYPWVSYDEYILLDVDGSVSDVHYDGAVPLSVFKSSHSVLNKYNMNTVVDNFLAIPGETDAFAEYDLSSDVSKKVARTMLKAVCRNRLCGVCFSDFDAGNVMVSSSGRVRFRGVHIRRNLTEEELKEGTRNNYRSARAIIGHDLYDCKPPAEIRHLLALIQSGEAEELYHVHASLMPVASYSAFFKELHDYIRSPNLSKDDFRDILLRMPEAYGAAVVDAQNNVITYWENEVFENEILGKTYHYKNSNYTVPVSSDRATCLNPRQLAVLEVLGLQAAPKQKALTPDQTRMFRCLQFLDFLRNRGAHRMEHLSWWVVDQKRTPFNARGSDLTVHAHFPRVNSELQYLIYSVGKHNAIAVDNFL